MRSSERLRENSIAHGVHRSDRPVVCERVSEWAIRVKICQRLQKIPLAYINNIFYVFESKRSHIAVHNGEHGPISTVGADEFAVGENVSRINGDDY